MFYTPPAKNLSEEISACVSSGKRVRVSMCDKRNADARLLKFKKRE